MPYSSLARDYEQCRRGFVEAAAHAGFPVRTARLPDHDNLTMDWVMIGRQGAAKLLVLTSGTHGPELPAGSYCQARMLKEGRFADASEDIAVLMIHAVNPWGANFCRRNNEQNIDLCRNHIDFSRALPTNAAYDDLHAEMSSLAENDIEQFIQGSSARLGKARFLAALMSGQYQHAGGFSFGGREPAWSNRQLLALLREAGSGAESIVIVDYHTGVGPYGYGSAVCMQTGERLRAAEEEFGGWVIAPRRAGKEEVFYPVTGHSADGYARAVSTRALINIVLEFGTYSSDEMLATLLRQLLHDQRHGTVDPLRNPWNRKVAAFFCPDDPHWTRAIWERSCQVVDQAMAHFSSL